MSNSWEIAGFLVTLEGDEAVCRFAEEEELWTETPPDLAELFEAEFGPNGRFHGRRPIIALDDTPAISSRQLGALLTVYRAIGVDKLAVRGARPNVRRLFDLAGLSELLEY